MLYKRVNKALFVFLGDGSTTYHPLYIDNLIDAFERVRDPGFVGDGECVQDGVGAAAHRHIQREGVVDRLVGNDAARRQVFFD